MATLDTGESFETVDGQIVEKDALRIAERLKEYDDNLEILCIDPAKSEINDAPFIICERKGDGSLVRVFEAWQLDNTIIERVILADKHKFDPNARFESLAAMTKKLTGDRYKDRQGELADMMATAVGFKKSAFKMRNHEGDMVKINEKGPVEKIGRTYSHT